MMIKNYFNTFHKKNICAVIFFALPSSFCFSQEFVNNGDIISNLNGNVIFVNGNVSNLATGIFENTGSIYLTGDWTNNSVPANPAFTGTPGGTVIMTGATQNIQGTSVTEFYNLTLLGSGVKQLNAIDAIVENTLALNDRELSTNTNTAFVTNTATTAITRTSGFVSSLDNGALVRNTASSAIYLFPVGSSIFPARFRPVEIRPVNSSDNSFAVRFANTDATNEGFDILTKDPSVNGINDLYYHRIRRDNGTAAASITIYYSELDGYFTGIAHWPDIKQCWDGTYRGKLMNTAVFVYTLQATLMTGETVIQKGNIGLVR